MSMTQLLGSEGVQPEFQHNGITYRAIAPDQAAKARFESLIVAAERGSIRSALEEGFIDKAAHDAAMIELGGKVRQKSHCAGGQLWMDYYLGAKRSEGVVLYNLSLIQAKQGESWRYLTIDDYQAAFSMFGNPEVMVVLAEVTPPFLDLMAKSIPGYQNSPQLEAAVLQIKDVYLKYTSPKPSSA
jgi:hypothetical protein